MRKYLSEELEVELVPHGLIFNSGRASIFISVDECMALADFLAEAMPRLHEIMKDQN